MRSTVLFCFILTSAVATGALACDRQNALRLHDSFVSMGRTEPTAFHWFPTTQSMPEQMRATLMESYATADACLNGKPRTIDFYVGNKLIGHIGTDGFFVPLNPAYDLPARQGAHIWLDAHVK